MPRTGACPAGGSGRNLFERPLHWEFFYDEAGKALVRLHRILGRPEAHASRALRSRGYFLLLTHDQAHLQKRRARLPPQSRRRRAPSQAEDLLVILNFSDTKADVWLPFPAPGTWVERIDGVRPPIHVTQNDQWAAVVVPSNYGSIYERT